MFDREYDLRFKSDFCRSAVLYLEGGIYNDDDQINYRPITTWLKDSTAFASAQSDDSRLFSNSFMAATPCCRDAHLSNLSSETRLLISLRCAAAISEIRTLLRVVCWQSIDQ